MSTPLSILLAVLAFGVMIMLHELGHFLVAKAFGVQVNEFAIGMGPKLFGFKKGETSYSLRIIPVGGFCAMEGEDETSENPRAFTSKPRWQRFLILVSGAFMNLVTGFVILMFLIAPANYTTVPVIDEVAEEYTETGLCGIYPGDKIVKINGERVLLASDVSLFLDRYQGAPYTVVVERDGKNVTLTDLPLEQKQLTLDGEPFFGFGIRYRVEETDFRGNMKLALLHGYDYVRMIRYSLVDLFTGKVGADQMSGPVGITSMMTEVATQADYSGFFNLIAFISINLGVMNLLPLPALDGGRIFFIVINAISALLFKKSIPAKYEGYVHLVGLGLFLLLFLYVTVNDIIRLVTT